MHPPNQEPAPKQQSNAVVWLVFAAILALLVWVAWDRAFQFGEYAKGAKFIVSYVAFLAALSLVLVAAKAFEAAAHLPTRGSGSSPEPGEPAELRIGRKLVWAFEKGMLALEAALWLGWIYGAYRLLESAGPHLMASAGFGLSLLFLYVPIAWVRLFTDRCKNQFPELCKLDQKDLDARKGEVFVLVRDGKYDEARAVVDEYDMRRKKRFEGHGTVWW